MPELYFSIRRTRFWRYISFGGARFKKTKLSKLFPEMEELSKICLVRNPYAWWRKSLSDHNSSVQRGVRMQIAPYSASRRLIFESLDKYILVMFSREIAQVFRCISKFGERVAPLVHEQPSALEWWISEDIFIHRRHWLAMCRDVMNMISLVGADMPFNASWPMCALLHSSAHSAVVLFGPSLQLQNT